MFHLYWYHFLITIPLTQEINQLHTLAVNVLFSIEVANVTMRIAFLKNFERSEEQLLRYTE